MDDREPRPGLGDEAAHFAAYLDYFREQLLERVVALDENEQRRTRLPSGWSPAELLNHVLHMEQRWFAWRFTGEDVERPYGDWLDGEVGTRWSADGHTVDELAARLREVGEHTTAVLCEHPMDARPAHLHDAQAALDLRWTCFHVLQEYARHAGHLDIVVEVGEAIEG